MENNGLIDYFRKETIINERTFIHKELDPCDGNTSKNFNALLQENNFRSEINYAMDNNIDSEHTYRLEYFTRLLVRSFEANWFGCFPI